MTLLTRPSWQSYLVNCFWVAVQLLMPFISLQLLPPILIELFPATEGRCTSEDHGHLADRKINRIRQLRKASGKVTLWRVVWDDTTNATVFLGDRWNQNEHDRLGREKDSNLPVNYKKKGMTGIYRHSNCRRFPKGFLLTESFKINPTSTWSPNFLWILL